MIVQFKYGRSIIYGFYLILISKNFNTWRVQYVYFAHFHFLQLFY